MTDETKVPIRDDKLPSNSHKSKIEPEPKEERQIKKVVSGNVVTQKKGLGKKFSEAFLGSETRSVGDYIVHDVLVPAIKALIFDSISGGLEVGLFGEKKGRNTTRRNGNSYVSYGGFYKDDRDKRGQNRDTSRGARARHDFDDVILEKRGEAEEVLSLLADLITDYGQATVADFYDMVGKTSSFTDNRYGWTDLRTARVERVRGGYLINFPRTITLD